LIFSGKIFIRQLILIFEGLLAVAKLNISELVNLQSLLIHRTNAITNQLKLLNTSPQLIVLWHFAKHELNKMTILDFATTDLKYRMFNKRLL